jgi:hypothetical protein
MDTIIKGLFFALIAVSTASHASDPERAPSNGVAYPHGWQDWPTIAVSHRMDNNTLRVIVGNEIAAAAARSGQTNPWPDGAVLGKVVWKDATLENWPAAIAPGPLVHAEFMFKDSAGHADTGGWAWARWVGMEQASFNDGMQVCTACHTPVADRDWVFTDPAPFPR